MVYFKLCRDYTQKPLREIAESVDRDHATALYGIRQFANLVEWGEDKYIYLYRRVKRDLGAKNKSREEYLDFILHDRINLRSENKELKNKIQQL
tara:strand:+ start:5005 stop:5286 length:282 start_codon:yes stop_codon:yes gene_type:complete